MRRLLISLSALTLFVACGAHEVGAECQGGAADNDCVESAVCTPAPSVTPEPPEGPNGDKLYCRAICDIDEVCPVGFECRQAAGTMARTCQPSDGMMTAPDAGM